MKTPKWIVLAVLAAALAPAARATTFLKDVMLIGGSQSEVTALKITYQNRDWTVVTNDLNEGCGSGSDYIHLLYKMETDTGGDRDFVTGFYLREGKNPPSSLTYGGRQYHRVDCDGGSWFVSNSGDLNSNCGSGSAYIYLYYTKDAPSGYAVSGITVNSEPSGAVPWSGDGNPADLNKGCGSGTPYIYMHVSTAPIAYTIAYDLAGGTNAGGNPATYTVESAAITLVNPTRDGYDFAGWTWSGQSTPQTSVTIPAGSTGDRSYTAHWTPVTYAIRYDLAGGTLPSGHPTSYTIESAAVTLVNPTRDGYDFAGWTWSGQGAGGDNDTPDADLAFVVLSPGPKQGCTSTVKFYANNEAAALARVPKVYVHWGATDAGGNTAWTDVPGDPMTWVDADGAWEAQIAVPADAVSLSFLFNDGTTWLHYNDVRGGDQTEWMCEVASGSAGPNTPQATVTIPAGSTGDKFYTANWTPRSLPLALGNCWHVPGAAQPAGAYMRNPIHPYASSPVNLYTGNQRQGDAGNPAEQIGGTVYYRAAGATAWRTAAMEYDTDIGNDEFWRGAIPADEFVPGATVEYVIQATYGDGHDDTYLGLAAAGDVAGTPFGTLEAAAAHPFDLTYAEEEGREPAFVWHGGNAVKISKNSKKGVQLWAKTGYVQGTNAWANQVQIRYAVAVPGGQGGTEPTKTVEMRFDHVDEDPSGLGKAMWWVGCVEDDDLAAAGAVLRYQIAARRTTGDGGNGTWRLAEYRAQGAADAVFEFPMTAPGADALKVNGVPADYTTSHFFIDESKGETARLHVAYSPPSGAEDVQVFSNVGRRDCWGADLDGNGVPDAILPPSGDLVTTANTETTNTYFGAWAMEWDADAGVYTWEADIGRTGAYRLTARYRKDGAWHYYSGGTNGVFRDHAVVISPRKALEQNVYEVNGMTAKASSANEAGHGTFDDLVEGADGYAEFGVPYLNNIGANCLWLQPIHASGEYGLAQGGEPGSPYAVKDYFSVSRWYGKPVNGRRTTAQALAEFRRFVAACDAGTSPGMRTNGVPGKVGTINVLLDATFDHTSPDAVFGEMGERMGIVSNGTGATTAIASVKPGWYANVGDHGAPATWYHGPGADRHDIACAPDRGDFGKWPGTAELFYGNYSALVRHNPDDDGNYLSEDDRYDYADMTTNTVALWEYMGSYVPFWLEKTGHGFGNERTGQKDENGTAYDDYGVDGLRCDYAQGLPPQFWEYCINRARAKKWNFMFVAESRDGGRVNARNNRQFDVLDKSLAFAARNAENPGELLAVIDDGQASCNGGAVRLNLAGHDETMPHGDPWKTASRHAMLATVKGLPTTFYGQEQGTGPLEWGADGFDEGTIVQPDAPWTGFARFELRSGKWIPAYGTWNKLTIWENPLMGDASREMARLYGRINRARQDAPALRSDVQWMLPLQGSENCSGDVWALAKVEEHGALANGNDAVLAFVMFVGDDHYATQQTFGIPEAAANMLGLQSGKSYTARNLAATDPERVLWTNTTEKLTSEGVRVNFSADQDGSAFYDDGAMVYFLKLEEYHPPEEPEGLKDPEGNIVEDPDVLEWIAHYNAGQADIDALGTKDKFDECYLLNLDLTKTCAAELSITSIRLGEDGTVHLGVKLTRTEDNVAVGTRKINGTLKLLGRADLATGSFSPLQPDDFDSSFEHGNTVGIEYALPVSNPPVFFKVIVE